MHVLGFLYTPRFECVEGWRAACTRHAKTHTNTHIQNTHKQRTPLHLDAQSHDKQGGIKPNVSAFGADQFDESDPDDKAEKQSFFNYFYLAINIGSLVACTAIVWVQDSVSWTLGFALPAMAMACAVGLFLAGSVSLFYLHHHPFTSLFGGRGGGAWQWLCCASSPPLLGAAVMCGHGTRPNSPHAL